MCSRTTPTKMGLLSPALSGLGSGGGFERLHYLLESCFDSEGCMTPTFTKAFEAWGAWDTNPLYALLHEAIYCQVGQACRERHAASTACTRFIALGRLLSELHRFCRSVPRARGYATGCTEWQASNEITGLRSIKFVWWWRWWWWCVDSWAVGTTWVWTLLAN
jgi:hypothetical protein